MKKLSVIVPAYNEEYTIRELVERVLDVDLPSGLEREVIIVNDGSTDATAGILQDLVANHADTLQIFSHDDNRGKGAAIRTAIRHVTGDFCLIQDADLEYDPRDYVKLLKPILEGDADVVFGSRFALSDCRRVMYFWHSVGNWVLTTFSNLFTNLNLTDVSTCYKLAKTSILKSIPIRSDRFGVEPELTAKFAKRGCRIYEVPISYRGRTYEEGKKVTWIDGVKAIWQIFYFGVVDDCYDELYGHAILHRLSHTHHFNEWMAMVVRPWLGQTVLEIGAGLGNLTLKLCQRQRYLASDVDVLHLDYLRNRFGQNSWMDIRKIDVEEPRDFDFIRREFDTVLCLNVLEHVEDHRGALENIFNAIVSGGNAIVLVPQGRWLFGSLDCVLEHKRRYKRAELIELFESAGFDRPTVFSFNRIGSVPWFINSRVLRRENLSRFQLKLFDSFIWFWSRIDRFVPLPGLSLIAVGRRPEQTASE